jgi:hypothetical protein
LCEEEFPPADQSAQRFQQRSTNGLPLTCTEGEELYRRIKFSVRQTYVAKVCEQQEII